GPTVPLSDPASPTPTFTAPLLPGGLGSQVLTFQLTVSDGIKSRQDTVDIMVVNVNHAPVAEVGVDQTVSEGSVVLLDGSLSYDPDGDALPSHWVQTSGPAVTLTGDPTATPAFVTPVLSGGLGGSAVLTFA